jgi:hypothetical protein
MTLRQEQALVDYIRENSDNEYYNHSPEPDHCGHVHCTYHGLCILIELRNILAVEYDRWPTDYEFVRFILDSYGNEEHRGLTELGNVPAWKAETYPKKVAGVQIPHPLPEFFYAVYVPTL